MIALLYYFQAKKEGIKPGGTSSGWLGGWLGWGKKDESSSEDKSVGQLSLVTYAVKYRIYAHYPLRVHPILQQRKFGKFRFVL